MKRLLEIHRSLGAKPLRDLTPEEARRRVTMRAAVEKLQQDSGGSAAPPPMARVEDRTVPGPVRTIPVRVYTPRGPGPFPVIVYFPGGGFVAGDLDAYDASARVLASQTEAVVVSVQYRRAPEHPFPAAADDATAAFRHVVETAAWMRGDGRRIAVAGEGAGGNLAAVVALRQKRDRAVMPVFQLLVCPFLVTDLPGRDNDVAWSWRHYLGDTDRAIRSTSAFPGLATLQELRGLPPAMVITADLDPLRDEAARYARKLRSAGVSVELKNYSGVTREFFGTAAVVDIARQAQADAGAALRRTFESRSSDKVQARQRTRKRAPRTTGPAAAHAGTRGSGSPKLLN